MAAYKAAFLARLLRTAGADVRTVMTRTATRFVGAETFSALTGNPARTDLFDTPESVLHVRLAHEADVAVVAPATADLLARLALGLADDLLTATLLEASCPLVVAPAMHTGMWNHPATRANLQTLRERGAVVVGPVEGPLSAGDEGPGRMAEPEEIVEAVAAALRAAAGPLAGRRVLVTAGPTHEPIDPVRFLGNRSTGRMGLAVAAEAAGRGASVTLVHGPIARPVPPGVEAVEVETAAQMKDAVVAGFAEADAVVMAAAVADFRPRRVAETKIKKGSGLAAIELEPTEDVLAALGAAKRDGQVLVGFAAETGEDAELLAEASRKLQAKNADLIVVNRVGRAGTGFGSGTDLAAIVARSGGGAPLRMWDKRELAAAICDRLEDLLDSR